MPTWTEDLPQWENEGVAPPSAKRTEGWLPEEKPPAGWFNWLLNRAYKCIEEIRDKLHLVSTTGSYTDLENVPSEFTPSTHTIGGARHTADTLANLNSKISDANLDDAGDSRTPLSHGNEAHDETYITDTQSHAIGSSAYHSADTLANLNSRITDANLDDAGSSRTPLQHGNEAHDETYITDTQAHGLGSAYHNADTLSNFNSKISDATLDDVSGERTAVAHTIGGNRHTADTLANLNSKISDANLDAAGTTRPPTVHDLGGSAHGADTLANLNSKISDANLDDAGDKRVPEDHGNEAHNDNYITDTQSHGLGSSTYHTSTTLANLNSLISDANLDDSGASRNPNSHGNAAHSPNFATESDLSTHIGHVAASHNVHGLRANSLAIGEDAVNLYTSFGNVAIGRRAQTNNGGGVAVGSDSLSSDDDAIAIGNETSATGDMSVCVGANSVAAGYASVVLGALSSTANNVQVAIGYDAKTTSAGSDIAIGHESRVVGANGVAIGMLANADGGGIAIGEYTVASPSSVAIGQDAAAAGLIGVAVGNQATASGDFSVALGSGASATQDHRGTLGATGSFGTYEWVVPGHFSVTGDKNFDITNPANPEEDLRHGAVESPDAQNLYRYTMEVEDEYTEKLPDWFMPLNKDPQVWVSPDRHFGRGYGYVEDGELKVVCDTPGVYNVLVIGARNEKGQAGRAITKPKGLTWDGKTSTIIDEEEEEVDGEIMSVRKTYKAPEGECTKRIATHYQGAEVLTKDGRTELSKKDYTHTTKDFKKAKQLTVKKQPVEKEIIDEKR